MNRNVKTMIPLVGLLTALGCENMGLDDPGSAEEGRHRPPTALVASVVAPAAPAEGRDLIVDGRVWVASGRPAALEQSGLRPVGSANGRTVHARTWDRPPYDELFAPIGDGRQWLSYRPVLGADVPSGSPDRSSAAEPGAEVEHGASGDPAGDDPTGGDPGEH